MDIGLAGPTAHATTGLIKGFGRRQDLASLMDILIDLFDVGDPPRHHRCQ